MNILVDILILAIAGVTIFLAGKRGFIRTAVTAASSLIALAVVICFTGLLSGILAATPLADAVHSGTSAFVEKLAENESIADLAQDSEGPLLTALDKVGVDTEAFSAWTTELTAESDTALREEIVDYVAEPVTALLGGYTGEKLVLATRLMTVLGFAIMFNAVVLVTTAIMQAHGHATRPVINMLIGGVLKLAAVFILTGNPNIGIVGTPVGTLLCYLAISVLNIYSIRTLLDHPPAILKNLVRTFLAALIMGIFVFAVFTGLKTIGITSRLILCGAPIVVGVVVYCFAVLKLKAITREDCLLLPKGEKIAKLLRL